ncbi:hypothetical protein AUJ14_05160 [Candidatus Micrarchaeota archaeon CG1_02_55_22]|nr:MAG: hypothetical protein AUJ14_05160 [Candidatus Micrarchaeota archaeon CG1_02_55_22]
MKTGLLDSPPAKTLAEYRAVGGLNALTKVLTLSPEEVVGMVFESGLRGKGGAGYPTGKKWSFLLGKNECVVVCNAAESEPGCEKDHYLGEEKPLIVLEGVLIAAAALAAKRCVVLVKRNSPRLSESFEKALAELKAGKVAGAESLEVVLGTSHYLMGEESSIINLLNKKPPLPYRRPPYPAEKGVDGLPTLVNNAETFANIPLIINLGAAEYATNASFLCTLHWQGKKKLVEARFGESIEQLAKRCKVPLDGVKACLTTPSGGFVPRELFTEPLDYDGYARKGISFGSGAMIFLDENVSIPRQTLELTKFFGKWTCRQCKECSKGIGIDAVAVLEAVCAGTATRHDYESLASLSDATKGVVCGLAPAAGHAIRTATRFYAKEFEASLAGKTAGTDCWVEGL